MRSLVVLTWLLAASEALARGGDALEAPSCETLDEPEFRALVLDSQSAIDRDDATLHASILDEVRSRVPCLTFAPSSRLWADFLVGVAIVEFYREGDWQTPMGAALRIRPTVDRGVGGGHPLASWTPSEASPETSVPVPSGVRLYVDGELAGELPPAQGLYLVQREQDGNWATLLLVNQAIPDGWLTAAIEAPRRLGGWASVSGVLGAGGALQFPEERWGSDWVHRMDYSSFADEHHGLLGPSFGLAAHGVLTYGSLGVAGNFSLPWLRHVEKDAGKWEVTRASGATVRLAPVWTNGRVYAGPGVGVTSADVYEADGHRALPLPYVLGVAGTRGLEHKRWDGEVAVGAGLATQVLAVRGGARPLAEARNLRLGFDVSGQRGSFLGRDETTLENPALGEGDDPVPLEATTVAWRAVMQLGLVWE